MQLHFRPIERSDFPLLSQWLAAAHVAPWWREEHDLESVEANYGPVVDGVDSSEVFVVEADGRPIGLAQRYRLSDNPDWERVLSVAGPARGAAGVDYLIGVEALTGRGLGPAMISQFAEDTFRRYPDVQAILVSVQQVNRRSWRALEKAGFRLVWSGHLDSDDPSDEGPSHVYEKRRGPPAPGANR